ncbi:MAG TPA: hypothetical protein DER23_08005 [Clostridiales bacterium]|nr:hypothetical protein [Clostridiales bacterium]HCG36271.1 hypothetical protein [Clostridiales bacterium]
MYNGDLKKGSYEPKNSQLRQEYTRKLKERMDEKGRGFPVVRHNLTPEPLPPPTISQKLTTISFTQGDWLILGLMVFFLFMAEEPDYLLVGILAYLLLTD